MADTKAQLESKAFNIASVGLYGRNEEESTLRSCFDRMMKTKRSTSMSFDSKLSTQGFLTSDMDKELVFILGNSGVGKSSLAKTILADVSSLENGLFVEGKFDLKTDNEPYSGVANAFGTICQELLSSRKESIAAVGRMISNNLRDEVQVLLPLIPELKEIFNFYKTTTTRRNSIKETKKRNIENMQDQLKYAFRLLSRSLNAAFSPIVLVLDDLQWSDQASLQVIDYLVSDMQNSNQLMIIGCYRSEEVSERGALSKSIDTLKEKETKSSFNLTEIELNSCQVDHVNKIIMTIMSTKNEKDTQELAEICYRRTAGNPYFVLHFMSMLEYEGLTIYDATLKKWTWNTNEIERQTKFTTNILYLLKGRMKKMPDDVQLLLQYAACLGTSFTLSTVEIIWKELGTNKSDLHGLLHTMIKEQFIEEHGDSGYRWAHDKVQEAAIALSDKVNASFKFQIGKTLVSALDEKQLEDELFDVVDLINRGNIATRPELAALNFRAAEKARSLSAFQSAAKYVEFGAAMLPRDHWESHRDLTLALYTVGVEVELALGNNGSAAVYCNAVFERKDVVVMEKLPLRMAVIDKLSSGNSEMMQHALDMCLASLKELQYPLVWSKGIIRLQAIGCLIKTIKSMKQWLGEKNENTALKEMRDPKQLAIMRLLSRMTINSYQLESTFLNCLCTCHLLKMTMRHGACSLSAKALADIGMVSWAIMKEDFSVALSCAETALAMQERLDPQYKGHTILDAYALCLCWNRPPKSCISPLQHGYSSAMRNGEVECACMILGLLHFWIPYISGKPIAKMLKGAPKLVSHMEDLGQDQAMYIKMFWQLFLNLTSASGIIPLLEGSVFSTNDVSLTGGTVLGAVYFLEGELIFCSSLEAAAKRAIIHGDKYEKLCPGVFTGMVEKFHRGVALYAMARQTGKRKFRTRAAKIRKTIKKWIEDGNPNIEHYDLLMDAERAALNPKTYEEAGKLYEAAIQSASAAGHLQHIALGNERLADFLLHHRIDFTGAVNRFKEAIRYYERWGAMGKVHDLKLQMRNR